MIANHTSMAGINLVYAYYSNNDLHLASLSFYKVLTQVFQLVLVCTIIGFLISRIIISTNKAKKLA
jgi:uncharacterized membrane protein